MKYAFILIGLLGCTSPHVYQLQNGAVINCGVILGDYCGMFLDQCNDGNKYYCQINLKEMSEEGIFKAVQQETKEVGKGRI